MYRGMRVAFSHFLGIRQIRRQMWKCPTQKLQCIWWERQDIAYVALGSFADRASPFLTIDTNWRDASRQDFGTRNSSIRIKDLQGPRDFSFSLSRPSKLLKTKTGSRKLEHNYFKNQTGRQYFFAFWIFPPFLRVWYFGPIQYWAQKKCFWLAI